MNHGTENPAHYRTGGPGFNAVDIGHFNLNLWNVYLQDYVDGQHVRGIMLKVGSFRRAVKVQRRQDERYHRQFHKTRDVKSRAPEQLYASDMRGMRPWLKNSRGDDRPGRGNKLKSVTYSSRTNVWQVGLIMFCIIHMTKEVDRDNVERIWDRSTGRLATGKYCKGE
ncbi:4d04a4de-c530-4c57-9ce2-5729ba4c31b4-CDS [Sclerotinia trifoliorum]|uniref:4d04a4de-c530-4c57-9ce2-5729ba4c31b4-CDS n=1 Tax=Sclerotinia trifoliorum TaxID=28548 RepID=A0A8H2VXG6_9HELO|nr:4d04a4de-c530-4c57-9ce2-5729ba4c31b4-CDS [Sclerotinia trifoliorum]